MRWRKKASGTESTPSRPCYTCTVLGTAILAPTSGYSFLPPISGIGIEKEAISEREKENEKQKREMMADHEILSEFSTHTKNEAGQSECKFSTHTHVTSLLLDEGNEAPSSTTPHLPRTAKYSGYVEVTHTSRRKGFQEEHHTQTYCMSGTRHAHYSCNDVGVLTGIRSYTAPPRLQPPPLCTNVSVACSHLQQTAVGT